MDPGSNRPVVVLAGPTASGKSASAVLIAQQLNAEIVSADSRQIYAGAAIGTAQPSETDQRLVPHHFIGSINPGEFLSAGAYASRAALVIHDIDTRGKIPLIVGGSGFYLRALIDGLNEVPSTSAELRIQLAKEFPDTDLDAMVRELERIDPEIIQTIDRNNPRRLLRAIEYHRMTGEKFSQAQGPKSNPLANPVHWFGIEVAREELLERITERTELMLQQGLVAETRRLKAIIDSEDHTSNQLLESVGYHEVILMDQGRLKPSELSAEIILRTRQYAKRQMTWFRRNPRIRWVQRDRRTDEWVAGEILRIFHSLS